jgi:hypothetical protein
VGGGVGLSVGQDQNINFNGTTATFKQPEINISWGNSTLDLKVQVSKKVLIFTPFLGIGAAYGFSDVTFGITSESEVPQTIKDIAKQYGFDLDSQEITSELKAQGFSFRIYGGSSFDIAVIRLNLGLLYSPIGNNLGADFGIRFQI